MLYDAQTHFKVRLCLLFSCMAFQECLPSSSTTKFNSATEGERVTGKRDYAKVSSGEETLEDKKENLAESVRAFYVNSLKSYLAGGPVSSVAFNYDNSRLITACNGEVTVKNALTYRTEKKISNKEFAGPLALQPGGLQIATGFKKNVKLWYIVASSEKGSLERGRNFKVEIEGLFYSPDGSKILVTTSDQAFIIDSFTLTTVREMKKSLDKLSLCSNDGSQLLTGTANNSALLMDLSLNTSHTLSHRGRISAIAFSYDGLQALTGSVDGTAKVWDTATGNLLYTLNHDASVTAARFSSNGAYSAIGLNNGTITIRDRVTGRLLHCINDHYGIRSLAFNNDGSELLIGNDFSSAKKLNLTDLNLIDQFLVQLTPDQEKLLLQLDFGHVSPKVIEATDEQWTVFLTFPVSLQVALTTRLKKTEQE